MGLTLETLLEREEISNLVVSERYYRDTGQWAKLRACYHPDSSKTKVSVFWIDATADEFIQASEQIYNWGIRALHLLTPVLIHVNGARALSESVGNVRMRIKENGRDYDCVSFARFVSKCERLDAHGWRIVSVEVIYERDSMVPACPAPSDLSIDTAGQRESYKYMASALVKRGFEVSMDLPGTDRPETVERKMDELFRWLRG